MNLIPHVNPGDEVVICIFLGLACFVGCMCLCCPGICCVSSNGGAPQATETDELNDRSPFQRLLTMFRPCEPNQADIEVGEQLKKVNKTTPN